VGSSNERISTVSHKHKTRGILRLLGRRFWGGGKEKDEKGGGEMRYLNEESYLLLENF